MAAFKLSWIIDEEHIHLSIKEFLAIQEISRRALTDIKFSGGAIYINGSEQNVRYRLKEKDVLTVEFPPEIPSRTLLIEDIELTVVYEDEHVLVLDKPAYMPTIPSREHPSGSLANAILGYYQKRQIQAAVHVVTRLDRNTSGLVLIAKHRYMHHLLSKYQQKGWVKRTYEALVEGWMKEAEGTIIAPIGRKDSSIIEREVREDGQYACTHFQVLEQFAGYSHVKIWLETGRTHQIRVHFSHLGHPLLGDDLYGGCMDKFSRQALHCSGLTFNHPLTKQSLSFHSPPPFGKLLKKD
ncbi:RluA family pseudouridine synthase [Heyndrickxia acidicola]|uniref:Pseudouridine synthase n=1 Tax=Heyndrickxia acidicola TaxID=209389 RepID=A0ABU6MDM7_9BACI|nr:RluA family pseudouridine synthase [Heyndrickxia acidicola]MED1202533.1 RluA family pseudouridine synthase [Heyndrickxia acidicola]